jgi:hypothetical protein
LHGVTVEVTHWSSVQYMYENLSAFGGNTVTWGRLHTALLVVDPADDQRVLARHSSSRGDYQIQSGAGDGILDWSGSGGHTSPVFTSIGTGPVQQALSTRGHLAPWVSPNVPLTVIGQSQFLLSSHDSWYAFGLQHWSGGRLRITYHWN